MADPIPTVAQGYFDRREAIDSEGKYTSAEVPYFVFNASTELAALEAVQATAEARLGRLFLASVELDERINESTFKVLAIYEIDEARARESTTGEATDPEEAYGNSDPAVTFDTTGGTRHITQSLATISTTPTTAPSYAQAIEVDGEGNVNGCDVVMPVMTFSETHYFKPSKVTSAFQKQLFAMTGKVNNAAFRDFAVGEVLFMGASGRRTGTDAEDLWELTFTFSVSPNRTNISVGNGITVAQKYGWDYMWIKYGEKVVAGAVVKVPVAAYVERVYEAANFSELGIDAKVEEA